ncbi:MAG: DUF934 domain-containing protein [Geminicoccaceae bacterium]|nr:DUF934 domain-containing protein [Geminicoccaceae bacterium]MCB9944667.1 DUF934 domain-containing protein [Geminicoccaceae bacterium]
MPLLKNGSFVEDRWIHVADDVTPAYGARVIVTYERLLGVEGEDLFQRGCCVGVVVEPHERVEALAPWIKWLQVIALRFPKFSDGRSYSSARILRDRMGYQNELRAIGNVLVDQYAFMRQCGFDSFEIAEGRAFESWHNANIDMTLTYQLDSNAIDPANILEARHRHKRAEAA